MSRTRPNVYPAQLDLTFDLYKCLQTDEPPLELEAQRYSHPKVVSTADGLELDELQSHFFVAFTATGRKKETL